MTLKLNIDLSQSSNALELNGAFLRERFPEAARQVAELATAKIVASPGIAPPPPTPQSTQVLVRHSGRRPPLETSRELTDRRIIPPIVASILPSGATMLLCAIEAQFKSKKMRDILSNGMSLNENIFVLMETKRKYLPDTVKAYDEVYSVSHDKGAEHELIKQLAIIRIVVSETVATFPSSENNLEASANTPTLLRVHTRGERWLIPF